MKKLLLSSTIFLFLGYGSFAQQKKDASDLPVKNKNTDVTKERPKMKEARESNLNTTVEQTVIVTPQSEKIVYITTQKNTKVSGSKN